MFSIMLDKMYFIWRFVPQTLGHPATIIIVVMNRLHQKCGPIIDIPNVPSHRNDFH